MGGRLGLEYAFIPGNALRHFDPAVFFVQRSLEGPIKLRQGELPVALGSDHRCTLFEDSGLFFVHHYTLISHYFLYFSITYDL